MKIGLFILSKGFAGMERSFGYLLENLEKQGIELVIFTNQEMIGYYSKTINGKIYSLGDYPNKNRLLARYSFYKIARKLKTILKNEKLDLLHLHADSSTITYHIIKRFFHTPFIIALRGTDIESFRNSKSILYKTFTYSVLRDMFKKSGYITVVSSWQIGDFLKKFNKNIAIIPNGVDSKIFKPLKNIKQKKNVILFSGRFVNIKGIQEIVNVAKQLPQYEFWFAGQGPLANLINLPNTKNLGFKTTEELVKLYNKATICLLPSYHEGFSNSSLEITSCGRTLICTPKGFSDYIKNEKEGIIIPAKDEVALKNAIVNLMTNEKKRKILEKNARKKALQYSLENVAKKYIGVYRQVLKEFKKK